MNEHPFLRYPLSNMAPAAQPAGSVRTAVRQDWDAAGLLQNHIFPRPLSQLDGLDYYAECRPAGNLGGDFFDFVSLPQNVLAFSLGDVSGDGIGAVILMSGLQAFLRGLTLQHGNQITRVVEELNRDICQASPDNFYATFFYAHIDVARRQMQYVSAGHEPALLIGNRTGLIRRLNSTGTVLGLTARSTYRQRQVSFEAGDVFVACSDGIADALDSEGSELGQKGVIRIVRNCPGVRAADLARRIVDEADRFSNFSEPADDRTAVVIRFTDPAQVTTHEDAIELAFAAA